MHMVMGGVGTEYRPIDWIKFLELRRNGQAALVACDGVAHNDVLPRGQGVVDEDTAMATIKHNVAVVVATFQVEALGRYAVGRIQD